MYGSQSTQAYHTFVFSNVCHFTCVCPTALKRSLRTKFDMLFLMMWFTCLSGENRFMLISGGHISNRSIPHSFLNSPPHWGRREGASQVNYSPGRFSHCFCFVLFFNYFFWWILFFNNRYDAIKEKFVAKFGCPPAFYARAPGRVNIIGMVCYTVWSF